MLGGVPEPAAGQTWELPAAEEIVAPARGAAPMLAAAAVEVRRLREALAAEIPAVAGRVHAATGDPRLLNALPEEATWESVLHGRKTGGRPRTIGEAGPASEVLSGAGHGILRAGGSSALLTFSPFGGVHGH